MNMFLKVKKIKDDFQIYAINKKNEEKIKKYKSIINIINNSNDVTSQDKDFLVSLLLLNDTTIRYYALKALIKIKKTNKIESLNLSKISDILSDKKEPILNNLYNELLSSNFNFNFK